jgi:hypothetical protein
MITLQKIAKEKNFYIPLAFILIIGILLRFFDLRGRFGFNHDQDLVAWFVKDVLVNHHLRLIGQETSTQGFFIGPLYYYTQIPFFLLTKMDPIAEAWVSSLIGVFGIISTYFVFSKIFGRATGLIATLIYSLSFMVVRNDREAVMTMPVLTWSIWYLYALHLILENRQKTTFILLGILLGLVWHLNVALVILTPLIPIAFLLSKPKKIDFKHLAVGCAITLAFLIPFILFEFKHGFIQLNALRQTFLNPEVSVYYGVSKFFRVLTLINRNIVFFLFGFSSLFEKYFIGIILLSVSFIFVWVRRIVPNKMLFLLALWLILYITFFTKFSKPVSEYYLNGLFAVYILFAAVLLSHFLHKFVGKYVVLSFLTVFGVYNFSYTVTNYGQTGIHFTDKLALVREIKSDSLKNGYPCVSISFITDTGYELGYRYLFYLEDLKIKEINAQIPTYTIIYPLKKDAVIEEKSFGYLGLLYPEKQYSLAILRQLCQGENANLTKPMWGLSQ